MLKTEQQIINELITSITPELWWLFLQMLATICLTLLIYQILRNVVAYIFVRFDREISKNVKIMFEEEEAIIAHINFRHLILRRKGGTEVLIPITKVYSMNWEIIKNGV